jgi:hypothetical protein
MIKASPAASKMALPHSINGFDFVPSIIYILPLTQKYLFYINLLFIHQYPVFTQLKLISLLSHPFLKRYSFHSLFSSSRYQSRPWMRCNFSGLVN